jgi:hypothetical protein
VVQELRNIDKQNRRTTYVNILAMMNQEQLFLQHLPLSDEENCLLSGYVSKQNFRYWSSENPRLLHESPQMSHGAQSAYVGLFVLTFFKDHAGRAVTVNADC